MRQRPSESEVVVRDVPAGSRSATICTTAPVSGTPERLSHATPSSLTRAVAAPGAAAGGVACAKASRPTRAADTLSAHAPRARRARSRDREVTAGRG
jgi:hypothetical protein